jgi:hypothetical protein
MYGCTQELTTGKCNTRVVSHRYLSQVNCPELTVALRCEKMAKNVITANVSGFYGVEARGWVVADSTLAVSGGTPRTSQVALEFTMLNM